MSCRFNTATLRCFHGVRPQELTPLCTRPGQKVTCNRTVEPKHANDPLLSPRCEAKRDAESPPAAFRISIAPLQVRKSRKQRGKPEPYTWHYKDP